jgi:GNAT superfamily N-acetyltransferase
MGIMPAMEVGVRTARPGDPVDGLLFESAAPYYSAYAGGPERARRLLRALYPRRGHTASWEVCRVAEADGAIVGVLAAFPVADGDDLARRFVRLSLLHSPPWRIPRLMRHLRATSAVAPHPPERMLYVDALATDAAHRRRGVARVLLAEAERMAAAAGLEGVALDTGIGNRAARSLYERAGFTPSSLRPAPDERTARAVGGSGFVGYVKARRPR